ncbi:carotenoid biosynthesis protein [Dactylosporangium matsuzakiense]|uniref:Membrane protein n=1 Tax=Dactylosporangium matsuzakiense TaxID=53360 RepID=A0A9W6KPN0_9ACTN|nr:carotenoid biosynthesis protein [Dactylosporangium matsuzakiense]UWZ43394.1 carotenoid biosynthesis protein [Dactylosporangium matsuzakiense]GLL04998.1 membrane protein [Dactylosporangium matsuzakiense]
MNKLWILFGALVLAEIGYPLTEGRARTGLVIATVVIGYVVSVAHAWLTRGPRTAGLLVLVTTGGGLLVEAVGRTTGYPFGDYDYTAALGPRLLGVPLVIPLAWTWMAWPAWIAAGRITAGRAARTAVAGLGLAAWDLFLDPQMVSQGYWQWHTSTPALPGVPGIPLTNYLGWLLVAVALMALLGTAPQRGPYQDAPMYAMYLWTYASSILAHAVFLGLPASAAWGALGMGLVAIPLAVRLWRS